MKFRYFFAGGALCIILFSVLFAGCKNSPVVDRNKFVEDSLRAVIDKKTDAMLKEFVKRPPAYKIIKLRGKSQILSRYGSYGEEIILALNRIDKSKLKSRDTIFVPDTLVKNFLYYSPFPIKLDGMGAVPKLIVISQRIQAFGAYEFGNLVRWGPVSTGKAETPTKNGLFHTNWKAKETTSTFNDEWDLKWSFNIDNFDGISLHQYELPGFPASHSCARMRAEDAEWIYYWAEQWIVTKDEERILAYGTPVIIFGEYDYDGPKSWLKLADNGETAIVTKEEMDSVVKTYLGRILSRKQIRQVVVENRKTEREQKYSKRN